VLYASEVLVALGVGVTAALTMLVTPHCIEAKDIGSFNSIPAQSCHFSFPHATAQAYISIAVGTSSMVQARMMGSALGLAVAMSVVNTYVKNTLDFILSPSQIASLLKNLEIVKTLNTQDQERVRIVFGKAFRIENHIVVGVAALQVLAVGLMWRKKQISLHSS